MILRENIPSISALKDVLLVLRAKKGDREAFGKLYLSYLDQIYRYIFFRVDQERHVAEDIAQDVFLKAWEKLTNFKFKNGTFKAWLYKIARNKTIDFLREKRKRVNLNPEIADNSNNPENYAITKDEYRRVILAIGKLPSLQREVITMTYINDVSAKDVAGILKKSEEAIRALKHRALKKLKNH